MHTFPQLLYTASHAHLEGSQIENTTLEARGVDKSNKKEHQTKKQKKHMCLKRHIEIEQKRNRKKRAEKLALEQKEQKQKRAETLKQKWATLKET